MPVCDMCGSDVDKLYKTDIEGSELNVCKLCSKFGRVISEVKIRIEEPKIEEKTIIPEEPERTFVINPDYGEIIKKKREALGLKQEEFAKKINEKQALIHKIEIGHFEPSLALARKIERFLKIKLVEEEKVKRGKLEKGKTDSFTVGDFIKIKK